MKVGDLVIKEGDWISIDGTVGEVYQGQLETMVPDIKDSWLLKLLTWADEFRRLGVWANADYPRDAQRAREYGAEGIGLCRTEHMFFETERLPHIQKMIMTDSCRLNAPKRWKRCCPISAKILPVFFGRWTAYRSSSA